MMDQESSPLTGPYFTRVQSLQDAYPSLIQLLDKVNEFRDHGRRLVDEVYTNNFGTSPGRCAVLEFRGANIVRKQFDQPEHLRKHFQTISGNREKVDTCRLYVLEDLDPDFVELLGDNLGVDPHIFAEQTNTWSFTDFESIGHRQLPSLIRPAKSFTLRYRELRRPHLNHKDDLSPMGNQMTFAINRRWYEPWLVVESPSMPAEGSVNVVRRCASFWTSKEKDDLSQSGWNALVLVDPPMEISRMKAQPRKPLNGVQPFREYIFKGREYDSRGELWKSEDRDANLSATFEAQPHHSEPYHRGCGTIYPLTLSSSEARKTIEKIAEADPRDMTSPFDEILFYWEHLATEGEIRDVQESSVQVTNPLLKFIGHQWTNTLELVHYTLAQSEYFSDDNPATRPKHMTTAEWRHEFYKVVEASHKINYFRRKMIYLESDMDLNLERLGTSLEYDFQADSATDTPSAIVDARKDYRVLAHRLRPLRERANNLSTVANDIASLRAGFQSIEDSASGLSLSILATIIFPFTLVASMLSMPDEYSPGKSRFWIFFAVSIPLTCVIVLFLAASQDRERWRDYALRAAQHIIPMGVARARKENASRPKSMA